MILSVNDISSALFESLPILHRKKGNPGRKDTDFYYKDIVCAFDIETTRWKYGEKYISPDVKRDLEFSIMYIWQFQIGLDITIIGRKWDEFLKLIGYIKSGLKDNQRIVVYVHNLSYEFQFLRDENILGKEIDEKSVFILSARKILKFLCCDDKIEFRCSYIHSNMSLELYTDKMKVEHRKLSGTEFDYDKQRFYWTEMTQRELEYCSNDVIGLVEAITTEMAIDGDNLYSIPLTSTGYVRRDIRTAVKDGLPKSWVKERKPDFYTYQMLREAFRGGNTHANRFIADRIIKAGENTISEFDRSSSYPDVQLNHKFPISRFTKPREITKENFNKALKYGYAIIARLEFNDLRIKDESITVPYISKDKCTGFSVVEEDNGRILLADKIRICVTDIDLEIICNQYNFKEMVVIDYRFATYGDLPECIKDVIREYYKLKTKLKGDELSEILYMKSKNKLNAIYGNSAQDPGKMGILYRKGSYKDGFYDKKSGKEMLFESAYGKMGNAKEELQHDRELRDKIIKEIYDTSNTVLPYQFGVWTTAWARWELQRMIDICGDYHLYNDTDSVYYYDDGTVDFTEYNKEKIELSTRNKAFAEDSNGKIHYMGVVEQEHNDISEFKTMGAKKYIYLTKTGKLKVTTSGVVKSKAPGEILEAFYENPCLYGTASPLEAYTSGFEFHSAGGTEVEYIDHSTGFVDIDSHAVYVSTCAVIRPSTYTLSLGSDYVELLDNPYLLFVSELYYRMENNLSISPEELIN